VDKANHVCDADAIYTLKESKPCPKCWVPIFRTEGCDHMHCTHCNTHFNWVTLQILNSSSNHHYQNNRAILGGGGEEANNDCAFSNFHDRIPLDNLQEKEGVPSPNQKKLVYFLYKVTEQVRFYKTSLFDEAKFILKYQDNNLDYQIDYLLKKITYDKWKNLVYNNFTEYQSILKHTEIINIYLGQIAYFQSLYYANPTIENSEIILEQVNKLIQMCNENFQEIFIDFPYQSHPFHLYSFQEYDSGSDSGSGSGFVITTHDDADESSPQPQTTQPQTTQLQTTQLQTTQPQPQQICLHNYQIGHVNKIMSILENSHYALDLSMLGSGKTYSSAYIYQKGFTEGLVICPASIHGKWEKMISDFNLTGLKVITYTNIRGVKYQPWACKPYLIREETRKMNSDNVTCSFMCSPWLQNKINNEKFLLIIDEIQNIKNDSAQTRACSAILSYLYQSRARTRSSSRALLLSGSPIDKNSQIVQFFKTIGVMTEDSLTRFDIGNYSRNHTHENIETGLIEIKTYCLNYINYLPEEGDPPEIFCNKLFLQVIKRYLSSEMVMTSGNYQIYKYNGFYNLNHPPCLELLRKGLTILTSAMSNLEEGHHRINILPIIQKGLLLLETAKIPLFVRCILSFLSDSASKIVVGVNFTQTLVDIQHYLEQLGITCLVLDGKVLKKTRTEILEKFQRPSTEFRVLLGNIKVISCGIDLDDKHGAFPRICLVSSNYNTIDLYQLSHRFLRSLDKKSHTHLYLLFVKDYGEQKILDALQKKGSIMKAITIEQSVMSQVVFPCDFTTYTEESTLTTTEKLQEKRVFDFITETGI